MSTLSSTLTSEKQILVTEKTKPLKALSGLSKAEIKALIVKELAWEGFRAEQVHSWIYSKSSSNISEWSNLSKEKKQELESKFQIPLLELATLQTSKKDGTKKFLFKLSDGQMVESVLMRFKDRENLTACISSQVGCAVGCPFCATGKLGLKRNLSSAEIVDQVMSIQRITGEEVSNIVFMGQGEPLHNYSNVVEAIKILRESAGIGVRHITVSTSGLVPQIVELGKTKLNINLAVSLHSAIQETREKLVPIAKRWNMLELMRGLAQHFKDTGRRITFEYTLLKGINDSNEEAWALCDLLRDLSFPVLINLIPYNSTGKKNEAPSQPLMRSPAEQPVLTHFGEFQKPERVRIQQFKSIVERSGKKVTVRVTLGDDIDGACGQLANKVAES
ncbi:MAG: 23S rRNA (adenine(2503)-C(2))-methyltransferase RlmN [Candidatus Caenarcaniphilales bacterium]|nr:23S rRNA (adenine(2503)-C(2))-methyltransferase RlmN [Candidatus Caenarcaniphilales bacterium]